MELPPDIVEMIGKKSDWKSAKNLCSVPEYRNLCEGAFWKRKAIEEMGKKYFTDFYDDNFYNYLAARSRYLEDSGKKDRKTSDELDEISEELSEVLYEMYPDSFNLLFVEDVSSINRETMAKMMKDSHLYDLGVAVDKNYDRYNRLRYSYAAFVLDVKENGNLVIDISGAGVYAGILAPYSLYEFTRKVGIPWRGVKILYQTDLPFGEFDRTGARRKELHQDGTLTKIKI